MKLIDKLGAFYYVYNRAQGKPIVRHETKEKAIAEAMRLAELHNKNFYVLQAFCKVSVREEENV